VPKLRVTQIRSGIDRPKDQKATVRRLGLHRLHDSVVKDDRPEIRGMIAKVSHLVRVEEVPDELQGATSPAQRSEADEAAAPPRRKGSSAGGALTGGAI
jgi:large subunit ribosomal protein L30